MRLPTPVMRGLFLLLFLPGLRAEPTTTPLLTSPKFEGWEFVAVPTVDLASVATLSADGVLTLTGKPTGYFATRTSHENYRLHVEWRWTAQPGNGGILVHLNSGPKDRAWPECFQIQTKHHAAGDLLPMAGATFAEPLTSAPGAAPLVRAHQATDSEKPAGEWNSADIICRGATIEVFINGVKQNFVTGVSITRGPIGFQFEGAPFALRNVSLTPLEAPAAVRHE